MKRLASIKEKKRKGTEEKRPAGLRFHQQGVRNQFRFPLQEQLSDPSAPLEPSRVSSVVKKQLTNQSAHRLEPATFV